MIEIIWSTIIFGFGFASYNEEEIYELINRLKRTIDDLKKTKSLHKLIIE